MSTAKPPQVKESAPLQSTRQMLDELDALMDRMLAIPVNDVDDSTPPTHAIVRMPTVAATLTVLDEPLEDEEAPDEAPSPVSSVPLRQSFPSYATEPATTPREQAPLPALIEPPPFQPALRSAESVSAPVPGKVIPPPVTSVTALAPTAPISSAPALESLPLPRRSSTSLCLLPLVWFNQGFDQGTRLLGGPGRWLRGPGGRQLLGLAGLGLLAAAGVWLIKDWLGWTW